MQFLLRLSDLLYATRQTVISLSSRGQLGAHALFRYKIRTEGLGHWVALLLSGVRVLQEAWSTIQNLQVLPHANDSQ